MLVLRFSKTIAFTVSCTLLFCTLSVSQQMPVESGSTQTRPRRVEPSGPSEWKLPSDETGIELGKLSAEPVIRVGLSLDARSVSISTIGHLTQEKQLSADAVPLKAPLPVSSVRIEARRLAPIKIQTLGPGKTNPLFRAELAGFPTKVDAEEKARELEGATGIPAEISYDNLTSTWKVVLGTTGAREEVEKVRATLEEQGFGPVSVAAVNGAEGSPHPDGMMAKTMSSGTTTPVAARYNTGSVQPTARISAPSRELVAYSSNSGRILSSSAPVAFGSDQPNTPVRLNEKPYRGLLEVFANSRGTLTVVNVVGLEDYVRGVVPNELSPGGYPAIEALKAQAIAARTYAVKNMGNFRGQGFDLLPTIRSQVYGGLSTEHPLSTRAVEETRGILITYNGEPINALYTSTCGGRTEDGQNIFGTVTPYLLGRECAPEGAGAFSPFIIKSSREITDLRGEHYPALARSLAALLVNGFKLSAKHISEAWISSPATLPELREWLGRASILARTTPQLFNDDATRIAGFCSALASTLWDPGRGDTLLNNADVSYLLAFHDADDIPARDRPNVALLLREGYISLNADGSLHPTEALTRGEALVAIARSLETRGLLQMQKGSARPANNGAFVLRSTKGHDQPIRVSPDVYLFRAFGDGIPHEMKSLALVGGEPATFHLDNHGVVDFLEVRPAPGGAASDRFSPFSNWSNDLSLAQVQSRLSRWSRGIGSLVDIRIAAQGKSRRVTDLEMIGANGTSHLRGGRIRSALGLREQLFVIERKYSDSGSITGFTFTGRGWGHGVGMCQVGAYGLARAGWTYDRILKAYYSGVKLTKMYS